MQKQYYELPAKRYDRSFDYLVIKTQNGWKFAYYRAPQQEWVPFHGTSFSTWREFLKYRWKKNLKKPKKNNLRRLTKEETFVEML